MRTINCPACGARMNMAGVHYCETTCAVRVVCPKCGLSGPRYTAGTHRGAAIKAGRAMRGIIARIEARAQPRAYRDGYDAGQEVCAIELRSIIDGDPKGPMGELIAGWEEKS